MLMARRGRAAIADRPHDGDRAGRVQHAVPAHRAQHRARDVAPAPAADHEERCPARGAEQRGRRRPEDRGDRHDRWGVDVLGQLGTHLVDDARGVHGRCGADLLGGRPDSGIRSGAVDGPPVDRASAAVTTCTGASRRTASRTA
ncbi:hypothetical protein BJF90_32300 [Pseudonocardia sp. CNS-004]|nr:hypothetical protein BJF90_32300 [Pseudonocardia sp. CNS-004]